MSELVQSQTSTYSIAVESEDDNSAHKAALRMIGYNKTVLEFGCAAGHVTKAIAEQGCKVTGVEISPVAAEDARRYAHDVVVGDVESEELWATLDGRKFDVLLFGDVLEHLRDPLSILRRAKSLLADNGFVVISVPNVAHGDVRMSLLNGRFNYTPMGLLDATHVHLFTYESMLDLLRQADLSPVEVHRVVIPLFSTEIRVQREDVMPSVVDRLLDDPEAETYQFVAKSVVDNGDQSIREALLRLRESEEAERASERHIVKLREKIAALEELQAKVETLKAEALTATQAFERVAKSRTWRWSAPLRSAVRGARGLSQRR